MTKRLITLMVLAACVVPLVAVADWDPQNPDPRTKWVQLPDPNGWDVRATTPKLLANDFLCEETGWITDIHLWGSWKGDIVGEFTRVHISFHKDVPAGQPSPTGLVLDHSTPGEEIWSFEFDPSSGVGFRVVPVDIGIQGWYDPNTGEYNPDDHAGMWQVNIWLDQLLPICDLFLQEEGSIYWLDVQVDVFCAAAAVDFGWKTALDVWNDDAVWSDWEPGLPKPEGDQWVELLDPLTGESLDLAFVLTGIPIPETGTLALIGTGLLGLFALRRRK